MWLAQIKLCFSFLIVYLTALLSNMAFIYCQLEGWLWILGRKWPCPIYSYCTTITWRDKGKSVTVADLIADIQTQV